ncbi:hypothetical protein NLI96_g6623 [Meripilus lineatus]|uniref:F-box domain-containing protein n=1 Tax=Meripilus lineatus TaxID=2056292 RepID=A0AAD5YCS8_9APHY|nr:hypothetical protein NLI96_g6623 [Physisporinus lineatus]
MAHPVLTPRVANAINRLNRLGWRGSDHSLVTWCWSCKEGSTGGPLQDWTLCSDTTYTPYRDFMVRFYVESDHPRDTPLDFDHLIEIYIPHMINDPSTLPAFLFETFKELQECLGEFANVKKVKLALATWILGSSYSYEGMHAAVVAIMEEFMRSHTEVDLDVTIDGSPLVGSIPGVQTNELLRPIHIPIPWNIQRHIIESIPSYMPDENDDFPAFDHCHYLEDDNPTLTSTITNQINVCRTLRHFSLACRQWAIISQKVLFRWICLINHQQTDKLYTTLSDPQSSHLAQNVRRLSIVYQPPYKKLGEVISRVIGMRLSRLECLSLCAGDGRPGAYDPIIFPFHPSLQAQLSQLNQIRILHLHNFWFSHRAEFRRVVCSFSGVRYLIASCIEFGHDKLGDCRPIHHSKEWQLPTKVSWLRGERYRIQEYQRNAEVNLWVANIPNWHRLIKISSPRTTPPFLTPHIANAITHILGREDDYYYVTWRWRYGEGRTGGTGQDWTLSCVTSGGNLKLCLDFRFHMPESDQLQDVVLGCDHLMELSIPHVAGDALNLHVSLLQKFRGLQELLGGLTNLKKINLALMIRERKRGSESRPWMSLDGYTKQKLQRQYTPIIAITEEFIRSQTDFDMDFTIDGLPPEELHLLIRSVPTNELLWPIHTPIPWNIQCHIIQSVSSFVSTDRNSSDLAFDDLTHSKTYTPMQSIHNQIEVGRTLRKFSLVCRQWASVVRRLLFVPAWICLLNHQQMDKLYILLRDHRSSHLSQNVRRLSIVYRPPYKKIGEVIPRIIGMSLSRLEHLDLCTEGDQGYPNGYPIFPFHPSLRAQLSQLNQVRVLHLHKVGFTHPAEFRQFVGAFSGIDYLIAIFVQFGKDELGYNRPIHRTVEWQMPTAVWCGTPQVEPLYRSFEEISAAPILWVANVPNLHQTLSSKTACPTLTPDIANAIMLSMHYFSASVSDDLSLISWHWRYEGSAGGSGQDCQWTLLSCIKPDSLDPSQGYFRFRVGSDTPPDTLLGLEHLIELCIPYWVDEPQGLSVSFKLHKRFRELHELFCGFRNVEKPKLALVSLEEDYVPRGVKGYEVEGGFWSRTRKTKRRPLKWYAPILEEFRCSQTDLHLDITINGVPLEELRSVVSVSEEQRRQ